MVEVGTVRLQLFRLLFHLLLDLSLNLRLPGLIWLCSCKLAAVMASDAFVHPKGTEAGHALFLDADKREESNGVGAIFIVYMFTAVMASDAFVHPKESGPGVSRHGGWTCSIFLDADKREESNGVGAIFIVYIWSL